MFPAAWRRKSQTLSRGEGQRKEAAGQGQEAAGQEEAEGEEGAQPFKGESWAPRIRRLRQQHWQHLLV